MPQSLAVRWFASSSTKKLLPGFGYPGHIAGQRKLACVYQPEYIDSLRKGSDFEAQQELEHALVKFYIVAPKLLEHPAGKRGCLVVDEYTAILNTRRWLIVVDGECIDLRALRYWDVCPPVPPVKVREDVFISLWLEKYGETPSCSASV